MAMSADQARQVMERIVAMENTVGQMQGLSDDFEKVKSELRDQKVEQTQKETAVLDELNKEFAVHKNAMTELYEGSKKEFIDLKAVMNGLYEITNEAVKRIDKRIDKLEERGGRDDRGPGSHKDYIPTKNLLPKTFEEWKNEYVKPIHANIKDKESTQEPKPVTVAESTTGS